MIWEATSFYYEIKKFCNSMFYTKFKHIFCSLFYQSRWICWGFFNIFAPLIICGFLFNLLICSWQKLYPISSPDQYAPKMSVNVIVPVGWISVDVIMHLQIIFFINKHDIACCRAYKLNPGLQSYQVFVNYQFNYIDNFCYISI